jgi:uncharacterized membrane protein (DUF373 family)
MKESKEESTGAGEDTAVERLFNHYLGNAIHIFLSVLALLVLLAAIAGAFDTVVRDFPKLLQPSDEYKVLQQIIENILLVAIAAELGLLLLYHRTGAAIEVIIFVIARKIVSPGITALELLLSVAALGGLLVVRFYYLPGRPK